MRTLEVQNAVPEGSLIVDIEGPSADDELVQDAPQGPHVRLLIVAMTLQHLWTTVGDRSIAIVRVIVPH